MEIVEDNSKSYGELMPSQKGSGGKTAEVSFLSYFVPNV